MNDDTDKEIYAMIDTFEGAGIPGMRASPWVHAPSRKEYADMLRERVAAPRLQQGPGTFLCGTALAVQMAIVKNKTDFFKLAIDLYNNAASTISIGDQTKRISVVKGASLLTRNPELPTTNNGQPNMDWVDWIVLASVRRNLANKSIFRSIFQFSQPIYKSKTDNFLHASALTYEVESMIKSLGLDVCESETWSVPKVNVTRSTKDNLIKASNHLLSSEVVGLFVDSHITKKYGEPAPPVPSGNARDIAGTKPHRSLTPTHWILLRSSVSFTSRNFVDYVSFQYSDYGVDRKMECPADEFLLHYYGFVAAQ